MKTARTFTLASLAALTLTGCGSEKAPSKATAGGEILEGSASDAMLPLDTVRSQPPLAPRPTPSGAAKDGAEPGDTPSQDAAKADAPAPTGNNAEAPKPVAE